MIEFQTVHEGSLFERICGDKGRGVGVGVVIYEKLESELTNLEPPELPVVDLVSLEKTSKKMLKTRCRSKFIHN